MSSTSPHLRFHMASIWSGIAFANLFFVAIILMGLFPPPAPTELASQLVERAQENLFLVKLGVPLGILAAGLSIPFTALIAAHLWRIETSDGGMPIMAIISFLGGAGNMVLFLWPFLFWGGMYYRPDVTPEVFQTLHDITWLEIVMAFSPAVAQMIAIGVGGFLDKSEKPVFPRWCCFTMLWVALGSVTGSIAIFFFSGPFAWNGAIGFWIPATAFGIWIFVLAYCMWQYVKNHR